MDNKRYIPKHLKEPVPRHYEKLDENPVDLEWLNRFIDECQKEKWERLYIKKGAT